MTGSNLDLARVAQTNVALYRQMHGLGYAACSLAMARDAYELASVPFAGLYRSCGKPFVCHLVGTASIMASLGAEDELVTAAILHAAYEPYFFTGKNRGAVQLTPDRIRAVVGGTVERHVAAYNDLKWSLQTIPVLAAEAPTAQGDRASMLLLKLANEIDDHLDHSMAYCSETRRRIDSSFELWIGMADALRCPMLVEALKEIRQEHAFDEWAQPLGGGHATSYSVVSAGTGSFARLRGKVREWVDG